MSESSLRVIVLPSLVYPYFELDNKQDEIRKAFWFLEILSNSQIGGVYYWGACNTILTA